MAGWRLVLLLTSHVVDSFNTLNYMCGDEEVVKDTYDGSEVMIVMVVVEWGRLSIVEEKISDFRS